MKSKLEKFRISCLLKDRRRFTHRRINFPLNKEIYDIEIKNKIMKNKNSIDNKKKINIKKSSKFLRKENPEISGSLFKNNSIKNKLNNTIINLKGKQNIYGVNCDKLPDVLYCGRPINMGGWKLKGSIWANPFKVTQYIDNEEACLKYELYLRNNIYLLNRLPELVGKKLACWCYPKPCHTNILVKLIKERRLA